MHCAKDQGINKIVTIEASGTAFQRMALRVK